MALDKPFLSVCPCHEHCLSGSLIYKRRHAPINLAAPLMYIPSGKLLTALTDNVIANQVCLGIDKIVCENARLHLKV